MKKILIIAIMGCFLLACKVKSVNYTEKEYGVLYSGGNGNSKSNPIIIRYAKTSAQWLEAEENYIRKKYGEEENNWEILEKKLHFDDGVQIDEVQIELMEEDTIVFLYFK